MYRHLSSNQKKNTKDRQYYWEQYTDEQLLGLRMCDLNVSLEDSFVQPLIQQVLRELKDRGISLKPSFGLSDEWFCPDGIAGVGIPFYLAHPRLIELERGQVQYAEGESKEWCLKLIRHEIGHVLDNVYGLRRKRNRHLIFGKASITYPSYYTFRPYSRNFVRHLEDGYAQSHPAEDFAETFAVWLDPKSDWSSRYKKWPALKKLEYIDKLMSEIAESNPLSCSKRQIYPLQRIYKTLREHYRLKRKKMGLNKEDFFWSPGLHQIFSSAETCKNNPAAASFISRYRQDIRLHVARSTDYPQYTINRMISSMVQQSRLLNLKVPERKSGIKNRLAGYVSRRANAFISQGQHMIAL